MRVKAGCRAEGDPNVSHHFVLGDGTDGEHSRRAVWDKKIYLGTTETKEPREYSDRNI